VFFLAAITVEYLLVMTGTGGTAARFAGTRRMEIGMRFGALVLAAALPFALAACGQSETATTAEAYDATAGL
jgi:hypothetical protein